MDHLNNNNYYEKEKNFMKLFLKIKNLIKDKIFQNMSLAIKKNFI